jgi:hypothetical protein
MLVIVSALKDWRRYLEGAEHSILIFSDHKNLEYFTTRKVVNCCERPAAQDLVVYNFKIPYHPGNLNQKPAALSRQPEYYPKSGHRSKNHLQPISLLLKPEYFVTEMILDGIELWKVILGSDYHAVPPIKFNPDLIECVVRATMDDQEWKEAYNAGKNSNPSVHIDYLYRALDYNRRLSFLV